MSNRFTIALPVRNGGQHLRLCVESILAQNCGDIDLAILDNASDDEGAEFLRGLRDPRVSVHRSDRLLSIEENWARIKTLPKAEFLTTIGHDDLLHPEFLDVISRLIDAHPDAGLYLTHFRIVDTDGAFLRRCRPMPSRETAAEFLAVRLCRLRDSYGTGHVFRSATYDALGGIPLFPKLMHADDALFMRAIGSSYRATALEEAFSYRLHTTSTSGHTAADIQFTSLEQYTQVLLDLQKNDPAIRTVLARHFANYAFHYGGYWLGKERTDAYHAHRSMDPAVRAQVIALATSFGGEAAEFQPDDLWTWMMEKSAVSPVHRALFRGWAAGGRLGTGLYQKLTDRVRAAVRSQS